MGAPITAPRIEAPIQAISSTGSTWISFMKTRPCITVGRQWPAFSTAGRKLSGTSLRNRSQAVVGAKEPMPRASKKLATAPMATPSALGLSSPRALAVRTS